MSGGSTKRNGLVISAVLAFICALVLALVLLSYSKLSGAEFTAFVLAFAVLCVAIGFSPEIQEISIAGNVVKLREIKAEAVKTIESLKKSRIENLRTLLKLALKASGGFANESPIDPRNSEFCRLVELAKEYECQKELKQEIMEGLDGLLRAQLLVIKKRNSRVAVQDVLSPIDLAPVALDPVGIEESNSRRSPVQDVSVYKEEIRTAIEEYARLYEIRRSIEAVG